MEVYGFKKEGQTVAGRTNRWINGKLRSPINSKDGHTINDCVNTWKRRILEFIVPIIYLEKPKQVSKVVGNTIFGSLSGKYKVNWGQVIHEVVHRLVAHLEKRKPSPISPYLFHLYSRNECLKEEEIVELEVARKYLELGITPEAAGHPEVVEIDFEKEFLSPREQQRILEGSPSSRKKSSYCSPEGKLPVRHLDWRTITMSSFNFEEDPFRRVKEEMELLEGQYSKMEAVRREASKLLGNCKAGYIIKELKNLKQEDNSELKAHNTQLKVRINDLHATVKAQDEEIRKLRVQVKSLKKIWEVIGTPRDVLNKAWLFDDDVKTGGEVIAAKIVKVLVSFSMKMDITLGEMRKLVSGLPAAGSSQAPPPNPKEQPKVQSSLEDLKDHLEQRKI